MPLVLLAIVALVAGCGSSTQNADSAAPTGELRLKVTAGPTCPVETQPPTPECGPRPVERAVIDLGGPANITIVVHHGAATVDLPAGVYEVVPRPVSGLMGAAPPTSVKVVAGRSTPLRLSYDTGIR